MAPAKIDIKARQYILIDFQTGTVLDQKNADERMAPSSMSKLMTLYLTFTALKSGKLAMTDELTTSQNAWKLGGAASGGSTMFLNPGEKVKVADLIRGVIIQSGNDACIVLAEGQSGSEEAFADAMNKKAKEIGLTGSHFVNATGLPDDEHYMTARDLATLARRIINDFPEFYPIFSETSFTYNNITQGNRNPLLYRVGSGADGLKTGHTDAGGYGLTGFGNPQRPAADHGCQRHDKHARPRRGIRQTDGLGIPRVRQPQPVQIGRDRQRCRRLARGRTVRAAGDLVGRCRDGAALGVAIPGGESGL